MSFLRKDLSEYNSLMNQKETTKVYNKYKRKLAPKPTEKQKYYNYLTNEKPILDEAIYLNIYQKNQDEEELKNLFKVKMDFEKNNKENKKEFKIDNAKDDLFSDNFKDNKPDVIQNLDKEASSTEPKKRGSTMIKLFDATAYSKEEEAKNKISNAIKTRKAKKELEFLKELKKPIEDVVKPTKQRRKATEEELQARKLMRDLKKASNIKDVIKPKK